MLKRWTIWALTGLLAAAVGFARAESWPSRPVTMIVPFAAGGPTDVVGRIIAQRLGEILKQQVVVENIGGAGGMTGAQRVAQARPDGYEVLLGTVGTQAYSQTLYKKPLYNSVTDFTPVVLVAEQPLVLVVRKDFPASSLKEFDAVWLGGQRFRDPSRLLAAQYCNRCRRTARALSWFGAGVAGPDGRTH
jgi:tripartite-type tricarboxylate transporter receptor subunit TctC